MSDSGVAKTYIKKPDFDQVWQTSSIVKNLVNTKQQYYQAVKHGSLKKLPLNLTILESDYNNIIEQKNQNNWAKAKQIFDQIPDKKNILQKGNLTYVSLPVIFFVNGQFYCISGNDSLSWMALNEQKPIVWYVDLGQKITEDQDTNQNNILKFKPKTSTTQKYQSALQKQKQLMHMKKWFKDIDPENMIEPSPKAKTIPIKSKSSLQKPLKENDSIKKTGIGATFYVNAKHPNLIHRIDGPAIEWATGRKEWWQNGKLHRIDGPAVEWADADGTKSWFLFGKLYPNEKSWEQARNKMLYIIKPPVIKENQESTPKKKKYWDRTEWVNSQGQLHRTDGPAVEWTDGSKEWYQNDQRHRLDGPAIEWADGSKSWYLFGKLYPNEKSWEQARNKMIYVYKPPVVKENQESIPRKEKHYTEWFNKRHQLHRVNGPAVEWENGRKEWWQNNELHRLDGPAIERADGTKSWYLFGKLYPNEKSWEQARNKMLYIIKPPVIKENQESTPKKKKYTDRTEWHNSQGQRHRVDGPAIEYDDGDKLWYQNGQKHRTDGPAIEYTDGTKEWYQHGNLHRTDGPAIELSTRSKIWYLNDQIHRIDGPAVEWANGTKLWYLFGKQYPNEKSWEQARNKMLYVYKPPVVKENQESTPKKYTDRTEWRNSQGQFHRTDGPAVELANGNKLWYQNGQLHRLDGPAVEWVNGRKDWYQNNQLHRVDGPAVELAGGYKQWWLFGKRYPNEKSWEQARDKLFLIYKPPVVKETKPALLVKPQHVGFWNLKTKKAPHRYYNFKNRTFVNDQTQAEKYLTAEINQMLTYASLDSHSNKEDFLVVPVESKTTLEQSKILVEPKAYVAKYKPTGEYLKIDYFTKPYVHHIINLVKNQKQATKWDSISQAEQIISMDELEMPFALTDIDYEPISWQQKKNK